MKISELTEKTTAETTDLIMIETAAGDLQKMTHETLIAGEETLREEMDDAIVDGVGLDSDGDMPDLNTTLHLTPAKFTTAGYTQNVVNGLKLLDAAIQMTDAKASLIEVVEVTSAELLDIKDTPKTLVAAPAVGVLINPSECIAQYNKGTTDYTHTSNPLIVSYSGLGKGIFTFSQGLLTTGSKIEKALYSSTENMPTATGLELYSGTEPTGGDGTLSLRLKYELVDTADFATPTVNQTCCTYSTTGTFTAASLDLDGNLVVTHSFNTEGIMVAVLNESGGAEVVSWHTGDASALDKQNKVTINTGAAITGTWRYIIMAENA